ncbi:hypothetical protein STAS_12866 [Striga asiatica]|uniref:FAF domain-containing protein n=1 Tax=Striga asiatica TaxID=4170 RepID=A0A5A7PUK5_STRAF|nr:hypothetical protein STAS_12866 [Striga asiatica]
MPCKTSPNHIPMIPSGTKQGIVTILGSDNKPAAAASIRRTLSADMSSRQWLHQNIIFPSSSHSSYSSSSYSSSSSAEEEEQFNRTPDQDEVWRSIQASNNRASRQETDRPWGSILSHKSEPSSLPQTTPYVHPGLVKSRMTQRSLEICTESLGSETGSDCYFPSTENQLHFENRAQTQREYHYKLDLYADVQVVKYKSAPARPLPPPLPSAHRQLQARRENGRLVLEAVPVSPKNNFRVLRQGGRLVLTLMGTRGERVFADDDGDNDDGGDGKGEEFVVENKMSNIGLPEKRLMMKKFVVVGNVSAALACKEEEEDEISVVPQSLPVAPRVGRLNVYEYFWKNKSNGFGSFVGSVPNTALVNPIVSSVPKAVKSKISINGGNNNNSNRSEYENRDFMIRRGSKGDDLVTYMKGCKEPRRLCLNWEPYCIATS